MKKFLSRIKHSGRAGQALVEYTLVLALVTVVAITLLQSIGQNIQNQLSAVNSAMNTAGS